MNQFIEAYLDKQLANLIESSKGELMRQLGKRGLELDILRVK